MSDFIMRRPGKIYFDLENTLLELPIISEILQEILSLTDLEIEMQIKFIKEQINSSTDFN